ncbi:unnamed protein product [Linum tenue]|uniref:Uncharacterized protein n=1 Tax=Linum tenue TaxID=586396 RepID=A0AAV0QF78_9ROSI|nr:unnamed protein product [Linum tenue]
MALPFPYPSIAARRNSLTIPPPIHSFSSSSSSSSSSFCPRLLAAVACRRESTNRLPVRSSNSFTEKKEEEEQEDEDEDSGSDFQTGPSGRSGQYSDESVNDSVLKDFKWRLMDYNPLPAIVNPSPAGIDYSSVQDLKVRLEDYHPPVIVNPSLAGIDFSSVQVISFSHLLIEMLSANQVEALFSSLRFWYVREQDQAIAFLLLVFDVAIG